MGQWVITTIFDFYHLSDKTGTLTENVMVFKEVQYMTRWRQRLIIIRRRAWEEVSSVKPSCNIEDHCPCAPSQTSPAGDTFDYQINFPNKKLQLTEERMERQGER